MKKSALLLSSVSHVLSQAFDFFRKEASVVQKKVLVKVSTQEKETEEGAITLREVLQNAIKMQALYSNGGIKFIETSTAVN